MSIYDPDLPPIQRNSTQSICNNPANLTINKLLLASEFLKSMKRDNLTINKLLLASEFRKSMKRDRSHYEILSDEKNWEEWKCQTLSTIDAHNCENIVDSQYVPNDIESQNLFKEQDKFMYDGFISVLKTSMGRFL